MDFNDLLSFVQNVPMSAAQSAKYGLAQGDQALQGRTLDTQNDQFNKQLALQQAQQQWQQMMGGKQFDLQSAQQAWAQSHAGQEFDLQKAQQEWQQGQGGQQFDLSKALALAQNNRANSQSTSDLADAASARNLSSIQASQMIQDYFTNMRLNKPVHTFTRASSDDNPYSTTNYLQPGINSAGVRLGAGAGMR